jgi:hypothetical protein
MSTSIGSNNVTGNLELYSGSTKVLEADATTGVVSGLKVANATATGQAVNYDQVIGVGQTWQDVTASRALGVTYTNNSGKPRQFNARCYTAGIKVNGLTVAIQSSSAGTITAIIPSGATYLVFDNGGGGVLLNAYELN